ncbi:MAG: glycosyltransferase [Thermoguttaceae bacterium]|jgi:glycosyltransferase involved in cell wall biosynthesis
MSGKILYLSRHIPPDTSGSAIIALNLVQQFSREEMIVAGEKPCGKPAVAWNDRWPQVLYIQSLYPFARRGTRWWRLAQFPRTLWRCIRLVRRQGVDRLLVVFPGALFLLAGYLTARLTGVRLWAYFHNTYAEVQRDHRRFLARWLQGRVFRAAEHVFVMSPGMSELYERRYPGLAQSPLVHAFNEPIPEFRPPPAVGSPMRLVFCGNVNETCADALVRLVRAVAGRPDTQVSFLSPDRGPLARLGLLGAGVGCETISRDRVPAHLAQADVVLLPHGLSGELPEEEFLTIFPTKTVEYLICGRPILAHTRAGAYLTRFLREHDCALVVDRPDPQALADAVERLRSDGELRARLVRNALCAARQFQAPTVAAELRKWLDAPPGRAAGKPAERTSTVPGPGGAAAGP